MALQYAQSTKKRSNPSIMSGRTFTDGFTTLINGMNSGVDPSLLPIGQYASGLNIGNRGGCVHTRQGWIEVTRLHVDANGFQGCFLYDREDVDYLVYGIYGSVYMLNMITFAINQVGSLSTTTDKLYFCKADRYLVIQDGTSKALVFNGLDPVVIPDTFPIGTIMAYGHGRIFTSPSYAQLNNPYSGSGKSYLLAGDIFDSQKPTNIFNSTEPDSLIPFGLPMELGAVRGMSFLRNAATGTGLGPLLVFAHSGVCAFNVGGLRDKWTKGDEGFSKVLFFGTGTLSDRSITSVGNDVLYRSDDGIRSLKYTMSENNNNLVNVPISTEVNSLLVYENDKIIPFVSAAYVDNAYYLTAKYDATTASFEGLVVLDFANSNMLGKPGPPAYDGLYSGVKIKQLFSSQYNNFDSLYGLILVNGELSVSALGNCNGNWDQVGTTKYKLTSRVYTSNFSFQGPFVEKKIVYAELWIRDLVEPVDITIYWRPEGYQLWCTMGSAYLYAAPGIPQQRGRIRIAVPENYVDPITGDGLNRDTDFQFCISWTGSATIYKFLVTADGISEQPYVCPDEDNPELLVPSPTAGIELDDWYNAYP